MSTITELPHIDTHEKVVPLLARWRDIRAERDGCLTALNDLAASRLEVEGGSVTEQARQYLDGAGRRSVDQSAVKVRGIQERIDVLNEALRLVGAELETARNEARDELYKECTEEHRDLFANVALNIQGLRQALADVDDLAKRLTRAGAGIGHSRYCVGLNAAIGPHRDTVASRFLRVAEQMGLIDPE